MTANDPRVRVECLGGPLLRQAGAQVIVDYRDLAVVGISEVARHLREIYRAWRTISNRLIQKTPDVLVLIDFPDFNLLLARLAKRRGIPVFYYIGPQIWAWRSGRARALKRLVDQMVVILPFEPAIYAGFGVEAQYVGHPLLDVLAGAPSREDSCKKYRANSIAAEPLVGLLPGSRRSEIRLVLPVLAETASILHKSLPEVSLIMAVAPALDADALGSEMMRRGAAMRVVKGDTYGVIRACDLILAVSGTVTLEAAILGTPMIIVNRVSSLTYYVGRRLIRVEHVGLPNLIAGRLIAPEYLQERAQPTLLAEAALDLLASPEKLREQRQNLTAICGGLGAGGVADRVAQLVLSTGRRC